MPANGTRPRGIPPGEYGRVGYTLRAGHPGCGSVCAERAMTWLPLNLARLCAEIITDVCTASV